MAFYMEYDPEKTCRVLPLEEKGKLLLAKYPSRKKSLLGAGLVEVALCDVAFPVMHGMHGEDGTLQGLLEMLNVPILRRRAGQRWAWTNCHENAVYGLRLSVLPSPGWSGRMGRGSGGRPAKLEETLPIPCM